MSSFWDQVTDFAEGAWETVSTGASDALGDWADNGYGFGDNGSAPQLQNQPTGQARPQSQPNQGQAAGTQAPVNTQQTGFLSNLTSTQKMVGGGIAIGLLILALK